MRQGTRPRRAYKQRNQLICLSIEIISSKLNIGSARHCLLGDEIETEKEGVQAREGEGECLVKLWAG